MAVGGHQDEDGDNLRVGADGRHARRAAARVRPAGGEGPRRAAIATTAGAVAASATAVATAAVAVADGGRDVQRPNAASTPVAAHMPAAHSAAARHAGSGGVGGGTAVTGSSSARWPAGSGPPRHRCARQTPTTHAAAAAGAGGGGTARVRGRLGGTPAGRTGGTGQRRGALGNAAAARGAPQTGRGGGSAV